MPRTADLKNHVNYRFIYTKNQFLCHFPVFLLKLHTNTMVSKKSVRMSWNRQHDILLQIV